MYFFCSAFRAISSVWCSEPHFQFDVQIRCLLGVQSHIFSLTLRVLTSFFSFDVQIHLYFPSFLAFSAIRRTPSGLLSHIFTFHFGVQSHFSYSFRHSMPPSLFSLAFWAVIHIRSGTLSHHLSLFLTFRAISPQMHCSESQSLAFIFTGITHLAFMVLHLSLFSSPRYPMLIAYSSLHFQISLFTAHDIVLWVHDTYFDHVVLDVVFQVTFRRLRGSPDPWHDFRGTLRDPLFS